MLIISLLQFFCYLYLFCCFVSYCARCKLHALHQRKRNRRRKTYIPTIVSSAFTIYLLIHSFNFSCCSFIICVMCDLYFVYFSYEKKTGAKLPIFKCWKKIAEPSENRVPNILNVIKYCDCRGSFWKSELFIGRFCVQMATQIYLERIFIMPLDFFHFLLVFKQKI